MSWKKNFENIDFCSKRVKFFTDESKLIERLRSDILLTYRHDLPIIISCLDEIQIEQSLLSLDKNTFLLLWNQLFIYYLVNGLDVDMDKLKENMIEQRRSEYKTNQVQLRYIEDFANNCNMDNVINWFTQDSFVYGIIDKAFRKQDVNLICKF